MGIEAGRDIRDMARDGLGDLYVEAATMALDTQTPQSFSYQLTVGDREVSREVRLGPAGEDEVLVLVRDLTALHRSEEAREESEQRFRAIFDAQFEVIVLLDPDGSIVDVNRAAWGLLGVRAEQVRGRALWDVASWQGEGAARLREAVQQAADGSFVRYNTEVESPHGRTTVLDVSIKPVYDGEEEVSLLIIEGRDISENIQIRDEMRRMREMQQALRQNEMRYRRLFQAAADAVLVYQLDGEGAPQPFLDFNDAALRLYGYSKDELSAMTVTDLVAPEAFSVPEALDRLNADGMARFDSLHIARDGTRIPVETLAHLFDLGGKTTVLALCRDVTARKASEDALRQQARVLQTVSDVNAVLAAELDVERLAQVVVDAGTFLSHAAFGAFFYDIDRAGRVPRMAVAGAPRGAFEPFARTRATRLFRPSGRHITRVDDLVGHPHLASMLAFDGLPGGLQALRSVLTAPIVARSGEVIGGLLFGHGDAAHFTERDEQLIDGIAHQAAIAIENARLFEEAQHEIEERRRAEAALEEAKESAELASRAKSAFLASMSHELRTPLNAVIGYSELLQEEAEDAGMSDFLPELEKIRAAGRQLLALVNDVLDLSKIEAGKMELHLSSFDLCMLAAEVAGTVQPLVEKNGNALSVTCDESMGLVHADAIKVRQILFNLLGNASKFTHDGEVSLEIRRDAGAGEIIFYIRDSGIGMTEEQVAHLFEAFYRGERTDVQYEGTGLGLAITARLIHMMGGRIDVKSAPGQGSTFTVYLPARVDQATRAADAAEDVAPRPDAHITVTPGDHTVLVIDDDDAARDLVSQYLRKEGFQVVAAASGEEGLELARRVKPVAITTDVMMPGMDGWDVLAAIKDDPDLADTPVVVMTIGNGAHRAYALGAAEFMTKPIDRKRLGSIVARFCAQPGACSVMIVEDDEAMRNLLARAVESYGYAVVEAHTGRHALQHMVTERPRVILTDLMMPEMNGFELIEELGKHDEWKQIPIVVMTSKDLTADDRSRLTGCVETVLEKGRYSRDELLREISRIAYSHASRTS